MEDNQHDIHYDKNARCWRVNGIDVARKILQDDKHFGSEVYLSHNSGPDIISQAPHFLSSSGGKQQALRRGFHKLFVDRMSEIIEGVLELVSCKLAKALKHHEPIDIISSYVYPYYKSSICKIIGLTESDCGHIEAAIKVTANYLNQEANVSAHAKESLSYLSKLTHDIFERSEKIDLGVPGVLQINHTLPKNEKLAIEDIILFSQPLLYTLTLTLSSDSLATLIYHMANSSREQQRKLSSNNAELYAAMNEALRLQGERSIPRVVTEDTQCLGKKLRKGEVVMVMTSETGHDKQYFTHTHEFNPARKNLNKLVVWGLGKHTCIGKRLAQEITCVATKQLLKTCDFMEYLSKDDKQLMLCLH